MAADELGPVGFIGLGHMGAPMTLRLRAAGHSIHVYDTSQAAVAEVAAQGDIVPEISAADIARRCTTVILMLPTSDVVEAVAEELLAVPAAERRCRTVVDMSSSEPLRTRKLAERLRDTGIELLDAPVSGGVLGAVEGTLTIMAGGSASSVASVMPLLEALGSRVVHVGSTGTGHAAKALNNLLSAAHLLASSEAIVVGAKFGIDPEKLLAVVNTSSGRSGSTELKLPRYVLTRRFNSGFTAALLDKDVQIARDLAKGVDTELRLGDEVGRYWHELSQKLEADADHTAIITPLEQLADVRIQGSDEHV